MQCIANYEIESDISVVSDDIRLKIQHPNGQFQARIKNIVRQDYSSPFLLSLQTIFESPSLKEAKDIAEDKLVECLNMLALVTGAGVRLNKIKHIVDCTPVSGMRDCLVWADSVVHDDPTPFLNESIMSSIYERVVIDDGKIIAPVFSTDMRQIRDAIKRGETGPWQDLFRGFVRTNLYEDETEGAGQPVPQGKKE